MKIVLNNIGKRFNKEWIFRNLSATLSSNNKYAILGSNGCGKSTLLQIIAGAVSQSQGQIEVTRNNEILTEELFRHLSFVSPYLELPEEMTWTEAINFHQKFKTFKNNLSAKDILELSDLKQNSEKEIRNFSSGMKQRAKLSLAILSDTPLLLLDEPNTNLDAKAIAWYHEIIEKYASDKLIIVCSNYNEAEYSFCDKKLVLNPSGLT